MNNQRCYKLTLFIMNSNSRILPHLNICYLQKKAYDVHRKKIESIKNSLRGSLIKKLSSLTQNHTLQEELNRKESFNKMSTIKQQPSQPKVSRMKPVNRRKYFEQAKQNQRLIKRIETCASTINRKIIETHKIRSEQLKNRISKFKNDPSSHKAQLKSERSLQLLQKLKVKQKFRDHSNYHNENSQSKVLSQVVQIHQRSRSLMSKQMWREFPQVKTEIRRNLQKKSSFDKLMSIRHSKKIQSHFASVDQRSNKDVKKFGAFRQVHNSTIKKQKMRSEVCQSFWKSRCFTTQVSHN